MSDIKEILKLGKELKLEGEELKRWSEEQVKLQEDLKNKEHERRKVEKEQEKLSVEAEKELTLEKIKQEQIKTQNIEAEIRLMQLKKELEESNRDRPAPITDNNPSARVKLPRLPDFREETDDIVIYLERFSRYVKSAGFKEEDYATVLSSFLRGRALECYTRLSAADACNFQKLKEELFKCFRITPENLKRKFKSTQLLPGESFDQARIRIDSAFDKWANSMKKDVTNPIDIKDLVIMDQLSELCSRELYIFVKEKQPSSSVEMSSLMDKFRDARRNTPGSTQPKLFNRAPPSHTQNHSNGNRQPQFPTRVPTPTSGSKNKPFCNFCKKIGHIEAQCFRKTGFPTKPPTPRSQ